MKRYRLWLLVIAVLISALAFASPVAAPAQAAEKLPRYEKTDCQFTIPDKLKVECGFLIVKENRRDAKTSSIKIAVAVAKATSAKPKADPIVFLNGGPGGRTLQVGDMILERFRSLIDTRDFIMFDQRGVGFSEPALECDALADLSRKAVDSDPSEFGVGFGYGLALSGCRDSLVSSGINLASYSSVESAADLNDLRLMLGYRTWNLFGVSYGTRLALVTMRQFRNIRSVVLDSSIPPQLKPETSNVTDAYEILFRNCAMDDQCNRDYPMLRRSFYRIFRQLDGHPVHLMVRNLADGRTYPVLITASSVAGVLSGAMYSERIIPKLPRIITEAAAGDYTEIAQYLLLSRSAEAEDITLGAAFSIGCTDNLYASELCYAWGITPPKDKSLSQSVRSSVPTLVLAGEYDPVTPPRYGEATAKTLPKSTYLYFPTMGHAPSFGTDCARDIMQTFFDAPTKKVDSSCIDDLGKTKFVYADF